MASGGGKEKSPRPPSPRPLNCKSCAVDSCWSAFHPTSGHENYPDVELGLNCSLLTGCHRSNSLAEFVSARRAYTSVLNATTVVYTNLETRVTEKVLLALHPRIEPVKARSLHFSLAACVRRASKVLCCNFERGVCCARRAKSEDWRKGRAARTERAEPHYCSRFMSSMPPRLRLALAQNALRPLELETRLERPRNPLLFVFLFPNSTNSFLRGWRLVLR